MQVYRNEFRCSNCKNTTFQQTYKFIVDFKTVNFTDELIYDEHRITEYVCMVCGATYTTDEISKTMKDTIEKYKTDHWQTTFNKTIRGEERNET
jgi:transcription elongation factor Elf1